MGKKLWVSVHDGGPVEESHYVTIAEIDQDVYDSYMEDEIHYSEVIDKAYRTFTIEELIEVMELKN